VLTMPLWITVNVLGSPDNGVILSLLRRLVVWRARSWRSPPPARR